MIHEHGMREALHQAQLAFNAEEVPVGAALYLDDTLVAYERNRMRERNDPTAHAEMLTLDLAQRCGADMSRCTLYVTLEPCAMCAGAMLHCRLKRLVFGAYDPHCGCCGSVMDMTDHMFYHSVETWGGVMETQCREILQKFFSQKRCNSYPNPLY